MVAQIRSAAQNVGNHKCCLAWLIELTKVRGRSGRQHVAERLGMASLDRQQHACMRALVVAWRIHRSAPPWTKHQLLWGKSATSLNSTGVGQYLGGMVGGIVSVITSITDGVFRRLTLRVGWRVR
jgi:hypothetical protein